MGKLVSATANIALKVRIDLHLSHAITWMYKNLTVKIYVLKKQTHNSSPALKYGFVLTEINCYP